jgi:hypothetical protein
MPSAFAPRLPTEGDPWAAVEPIDERVSGASGETAARIAGRPNQFAATRIVLRPLAGSLALGFVGLSMATITVTALQLGWIPTAQQHEVAIALLAFVVPIQGIASIFGFLGRDGVAATGMGI